MNKLFLLELQGKLKPKQSLLRNVKFGDIWGCGEHLVACLDSIAGENTQRKIVINDIETIWVEVMLERWSRYTNKKPIFIKNIVDKSITSEDKNIGNNQFRF